MSAAPPPPPPRRGPRPLLLHLTLAMLRLSGFPAGSTPWKPGSPLWNALATLPAAPLANPLADPLANPLANLAVAAAPASLRAAFPDHPLGAAPPAALVAEAAFLRGVRLWRAHPWRRDLPDPPTAWREGTARLLDYGGPGDGSGPRVLFVPSLVNRWTVLDLMRDHSLLRWLAANGARPLLLDWGEAEPGFTLTDHIAGRLVRAMEAAGPGTILAGYCMGGTFAVAAAALRPDLVGGLALLAAPWDFHAGDAERRRGTEAARALLAPMLRDAATVPVDVLQTLFALDDPDALAGKFRRFGRLDQDGAAARRFVALEDWVNDGVPLSGATARECLEDWYGANRPMNGTWRVAGLTIDPAAIGVPSLVVVPRRDRIVPPESALPLARLLPGATLLEPDAGHVGMTAGNAAPEVLWKPLRDWLLTAGGIGKAARMGKRGRAKGRGRIRRDVPGRTQ